MHGIRFRPRAQAEEIVLSKAKVLTQRRVLKVLPGTKPYVIKNIPSFVVRFADEGRVFVGIGILPIGESSGPSIGQTLTEAIAAVEDAGNVAEVRY